MLTKSTSTNVADCIAAIRGQKIPRDLDTVVVRASLIRGIRLHYAFATSDEIVKLSTKDSQVARARNARLIMSNRIPETILQEQQPYCIWHPQIATKETYRELVQRYPQMRYQVGRACAAAGYSDLYQELDLLPDVTIAEEARESGTDGGRLIYEAIMSSPCRYPVMDDDIRTIQLDVQLPPAFSNGDTEVRLALFYRPYTPQTFIETHPGIEEDMHIGEEYVPGELGGMLNDEEAKLLHQPLPQDLPTVRKELLICMAAFEGNIDRYTRLKRPTHIMNKNETYCVVRGIYHHTMFARWWAEEITQDTPRAQAIKKTDMPHAPLLAIKEAISARRIMINDPRDFLDGWPADTPQPYLIWWPLRPGQDILYTLAEKVPEMKAQVAAAAIYCDYVSLYKWIQPTPSEHLCLAARLSPNPFYLEDLEKRAAAQNIPLVASEQDLEVQCMMADLEPTTFFNFYEKQELYDGITVREGPYWAGFGPDCRLAELAVWDSMGIPEP
ncbi:uncharacterized protein CTRU02_202826 [Colletotrichum truncatum]|uniref:Uncharacterized protein n=1 Tax=Colletotrichum truncatum TaxID=5467 RepID=A0ACC3ZLA8_COLTU|nr:uncharacterized protein CTRU02_12920 [Colletotrichum truncatum]KAF6783904.1 hypothetical protein CTRU02_12920 [Colletotrichum truncatum]